jgi:transposase
MLVSLALIFHSQRAVKPKLIHVLCSSEDILEHRAALWTFVEQAGVEPTNNHAECELRGVVLWRKRSFGTQSNRGNLFGALRQPAAIALHLT